MSRKPEQRLWDRHRNNNPPDIRLERIENAAGSGTPDVLAIYKGRPAVTVIQRGRVTWIENKVIDFPKREGGRIQFLHPPTIDQRNWHIDWQQCFGNSIFLISVKESSGLFAVSGVYADDILAFTVNRLAGFEVDWDRLADGLRGRVKNFGMGG